MKTRLLAFILVLAGIIFFSSARAQSVTINYASDSMQVYCSPPALVYLYVWVQAIGYNPGDSLTIAINFGDGSDTTWKSVIQNGFVYDWAYHTYLSPGFFAVQYIATGPDGTADTLVQADDIFVGTSCGNIEGRVFVDNNSDCIYNAGDLPVSYGWVQTTATSGNPSYNYGYPDNDGNYTVNVLTDFTYDVTLTGLQDIYSYECPASGIYTDQSAPSSGLDFALQCLPGYDLDGSIWGWGFVPGSNSSSLDVDAYNLRCGNVTGVLKVVLDPLVTYSSANVPPTSVSGDTLIWDPYIYEPIYPNNLGGIDINTPTSSSAQLGDQVCFTLILEPIEGDSVPGNNVHTVCHEVQSSWDPNLKDVSPRGSITNDQELKYIVMFQNTGTAPASNVYILDTFDVDLEISTFKFTGSSHPCEVTFAGNSVKFYFHNINLPDSNSNEPASHGWVTYSMDLKPNLEIGTHIHNTAAIYFDFNDPVITNTVENIISAPTGVGNVPAIGASFLYPNPAADNVVVVLTGTCDQALISIVNIEGKTLKFRKSSGCTTTIDISGVPEGIYLVKVKSEADMSTSKLIIAR